jgi:phosphoribosylformimino-5-aminoimidazole carboxamide ribotide isomerase
MAKLWHLKGARWLHVVDLDGALAGKPKNMDIVKRIVREVRISVEFGGGVRKLSTIRELLSAGVKRVILGTSAVNRRKFVQKALEKYGDKIAIALDVRRGKLATHGWKRVTTKTPLTIAQELKALGAKVFILTDVRRDGMLKGPCMKSITEFAKAAGVKVIASGGVTRLSDITKLKKLEKHGVIGAIVGKAIYSGAMDLKDAIEAGE